MDQTLLEAAKQVPAMVVLFLTILVFLNFLGKAEDKRLAHDKEMEILRSKNAEEREKQRREHELTISNMQALNMKSLIDKITESSKDIAEALKAHEEASKGRYEKMGITDDLLQLARERLKR